MIDLLEYREHLRILLESELSAAPSTNGVKVIDCSARELLVLDDDTIESKAESPASATAGASSTMHRPRFVLSRSGGSRPFSADEIDTVVARRIQLRRPASGEHVSSLLEATFRLEPLDARLGPRE